MKESRGGNNKYNLPTCLYLFSVSTSCHNGVSIYFVCTYRQIDRYMDTDRTIMPPYFLRTKVKWVVYLNKKLHNTQEFSNHNVLWQANDLFLTKKCYAFCLQQLNQYCLPFPLRYFCCASHVARMCTCQDFLFFRYVSNICIRVSTFVHICKVYVQILSAV